MHLFGHGQLPGDPLHAVLEVAQKVAADCPLDRAVAVVLSFAARGQHVLLREEAEVGGRGAALVHVDAGVHYDYTKLVPVLVPNQWSGCVKPGLVVAG